MAVSVHLIHGSGLSVRDKSGWLSIEGANVPYILRENKEKYIPVRTTERRILCFYPSNYPKEISDRPPLVCHYIRPEEVTLLNKCCRQQRINEVFNNTDPIVKLSDFLEFYGLVKTAYPHVVVGDTPPAVITPTAAPAAPAPVTPVTPVVKKKKREATDYGWLLIKDALVPYVIRQHGRFAPLNVIRGAAQLLIGAQVETVTASEGEIACLNSMCHKVGLVFTFQKNTSLADMGVVLQMCPGCSVQDLPKENPMDYVNATRQVADSASTARSSGVTRPPPPLKQAPTRPSDTHPATKSLQALANMAQGQDQSDSGSPNGLIDDDACVIETIPPRPGFKNRNSTSGSPVDSGSERSRGGSGVLIRPMECFGKTISCLQRGKSGVAYALVEAVCRVYFPTCSLVDFIHFLELQLAVTLYVLKRAEEDAFIDFYGIPTKQLRCNQVIKLQDLKDRMGWLQKRFGDAADATETEQKAMMTSEVGNEASGSPNLAELCKAITGEDLTELDENHTNGTNGNDEGGVKGKKNLENTIMRILNDKQDTTGSETNGNGSSDIFEAGWENSDGVPDLSPRAKSPQEKTNKRKGAPPRKCVTPVEKKRATDGEKVVELEEEFAEDSDMEEYK